MLTWPAAADAVVQVIEVALTRTIEVQELDPIETATPVRKPVPVKVRAVPPTAKPEEGERLVTVGAG
jgi:hypothetical protein